MNEYIIETKNLVYKYSDGTKALNGISMGIKKGKKTAIIGPNGAGKTTLFLHFNGIYKPSSGKVFFNSKELKYGKKEIANLRSNVGIVFQDPNTQLFSASVYQELSFGPLNMGLSREEVKYRIEKTMAELDIEELKEKPTHFLSGGEKKKVSIASILVMDPEVIVFDEPLANVDPRGTSDILNMLNALNKDGKTIIIATHDMNSIYGWADEIIIIKNGNVFKNGKPEYIFGDLSLLKDAKLEIPWIVTVYNEIIKNKPEIEKEYSLPRNKEELFKIIKDL